MKVSAKTIPCECGGVAVKGFASDDFTTGRKTVTVHDIPAFICEKCGEKFFDGPTVIKIENNLKKYGVARGPGKPLSV